MGFSIGVSNPGMGPRGALDSFSAGEDRRGVAFNPRVVSRLFGYLRPYSKQMALSFGSMLIVSALTLATPYLLKLAIDQYITQGDEAGLARISLLTMAAFAGLFIATTGQQYFLTWVSQRVLANLRSDLFLHLLKPPLSSVRPIMLILLLLSYPSFSMLPANSLLQ